MRNINLFVDYIQPVCLFFLLFPKNDNSVSRFARNVLDCIGYVRELAKMQPPIGVFFETENIYTLNPNSEMSLSFISTLAQEESHNKSEIMNASIEMRFRRGIFLTPPLLGYDQDDNGDLIINQEEAKTVRLIFFMYLYGYTCTQISETLTKLECRTKKGNTKWSPGAVLQQLENERHCGDVLARKTWTPSYLDHKAKKNKQNRNQYLKRDHHEAIISRDDFIAVQRLISNAKYGGSRILPKLNVISEGVLKGFVIINPKWAAFTVNDYKEASVSVYKGSHVFSDNFQIEANKGEFDLRGFEVARAEFFNTRTKTKLSFTTSNFSFSMGCLRKLPNITYVELLIHPEFKLLAVRPSAKNSKNAIKWCVLKETDHQPRSIGGKAFLPMIFDLFDWDTDCKYSVRGERISNGMESFILFKMTDTEIFYLDKSSKNNDKTEYCNKPEAIHAFPLNWTAHFGDEYYRRAQIREMLDFNNKLWNTTSEGVPYMTEDLDVTDPSVIKAEIVNMIDNFEKSGDNDE